MLALFPNNDWEDENDRCDENDDHEDGTEEAADYDVDERVECIDDNDDKHKEHDNNGDDDDNDDDEDEDDSDSNDNDGEEDNDDNDDDGYYIDNVDDENHAHFYQNHKIFCVISQLTNGRTDGHSLV